MTVITRKYNPGFLSDEELVRSFCVRTNEFQSLVEDLRECTGNSNTHQIVIGPRGSGKTSLLLRVAAEIRRDKRLSEHFFPIVFAEESYEISTAGEFWLECLSRLADQALHGEDASNLRLSCEELRQAPDDRILECRCLGEILDFASRKNKRLVLVVENLNMLFRDVSDGDTGWRLRKVLQTEPCLLLLASATSRFDEIDNRECALYDLFRVLDLKPLDADDCATLWHAISGQCRAPETIQALRIFTGGSPRLLTIVARFGAKRSFRELRADLLNLIDDHTEYFKSHLDALPAQERKVYLAAADLWKPATAREIADRARLDINRCSAQLKRLIGRGVIVETGGTPRRKLYYLSERLYNIYYLMRRAHGPSRMIEALIRFMEAFYSPTELKDFAVRMAEEGPGLDSKARSFEAPDRALAAWENFICRFAASTAPEELKEAFEQACALEDPAEALAAWENFICRFAASTAPEHQDFIASAFVAKGMMLVGMDRLDDAIAAWDGTVQRFRISDRPEVLQAVAWARFLIGSVLASSNQSKEALDTLMSLLQDYEESKEATTAWLATRTFMQMGRVYLDLNEPDSALSYLDQAIRRCETEEPPEDSEVLPTFEVLAASLVMKGMALLELDRSEESFDTWEEVVRRFESRDESELQKAVSQSLLGQSKALTKLGRLDEAMAVLDEAIRRNGPDATTESTKAIIVSALIGKAELFARSERLDEVLAVWEEVFERFSQDDDPELRDSTEFALLMKAAFEMRNGKSGTAIDLISPILERQDGEFYNRYAGYRLRARAFLAEGMPEACEKDVVSILAMLPKAVSSNAGGIYDLIEMASELDMERMRDTIKASLAADLLLPLTTALEMELGLEPRVAKEVEEVAEDVREQLTIKERVESVLTGPDGEVKDYRVVEDG